MDDVILLDEHMESYTIVNVNNIVRKNGLIDKIETLIKNQKGVFSTVSDNESKMFPQGTINFDTLKLHTKTTISKGSFVIRDSTGVKYYLYANKNYSSISDLKTYIINLADDNNG